jgi:acrylyl-CoA reductase (NADPH)
MESWEGPRFVQLSISLILRESWQLGVDMPSSPLEVRQELWEEITREGTLLSLVDSITTEVTLEEIPRVARAMLDGQMRGRILVRPNEQ